MMHLVYSHQRLTAPIPKRHSGWRFLALDSPRPIEHFFVRFGHVETSCSA